MAAIWEITVVPVPSSTGLEFYPLDGEPEAMIFYGTNWTAEDTVDTSNGLGMFRGMAGFQYDSLSTLLQNAACVISTPAGNAHMEDNHAILMLDTSGGATELYTADVDSFDSGGFTLDWLIAPGGGYKVICIALMGVGNTSVYIGGDATISLGYRAGAMLMHGAWAGPVIAGSDRTQEWYGGAAYPVSGITSAGLTAFTFPTSFSGQYNIGIYTNGPHVNIAQSGNFVGPFLLTQNITGVLTGVGDTSFDFNTHTADNQGMLLFWDDEANHCNQAIPGLTTGQTATVSGLPFAPGLVITYTISNHASVQGTGSVGAIGFSVATPDFQWAATVDGVNQGAFQSFQRGFVDVVQNTDVHAGTIDLTPDGFVMTTAEDTAPRTSVAWHAFGHPSGAWLPTIDRYRRHPVGRRRF
jgi:hypothetical protein